MAGETQRIQEIAHSEEETAPVEEQGVTLRAIGIGLLLAVGISLLSAYVRYVVHGSFMAYSQMPMSLLILFIILLIGLNFVSKLLRKGPALSPSEWLTIFAMGFVASSIPCYGIVGYLVGMMATPYYFATPENEWAAYVHPRLPSWLIPSNEGEAITWFYEGLPGGMSIPWGIWILPLLWWLSFIGAVVFVLTCMAIILRKQWSQNEKLVYPVLGPAVEMTSELESGRFFPGFMRGSLFWIGFWLTFGMLCWNILRWFYYGFPQFPINRPRWIWLGRNFPPLFGNLSPIIISFSYFASLDVLFSVWFFDLVFIIEGGLLNRIGVTAISPYYGTGRYRWQTIGGFVVLVLWGFWIGRRHLRDVILKTFRPGYPADDREEMLPYRGAFIGLLVGIAYIVFWLHQVGMDYTPALLLVLFMFIVYLGVAKIIADSGLIYIGPPSSAWGLTTSFLGGTTALASGSIVGLAMSAIAMTSYKALTTPALVHVARIGDLIKGSRRRLFAAICLAFFFGIVSSLFITLYLGYKDGAYNFQPNYPVVRANIGRFRWIANTIKSPGTIEAENFYYFGIGAAVMSALTLLRYRFTWWPFHPIGFAISGVWLTRLTSVTVFFAWVIKLVMLKLGGAASYRRAKPLFVGLLTGYVLGVAVSTLVDAIWFLGSGHVVHRWY